MGELEELVEVWGLRGLGDYQRHQPESWKGEVAAGIAAKIAIVDAVAGFRRRKHQEHPRHH